MSELATLTARLEKLQDKRAAGTRLVALGDERVEYKTDREMAAAIADIERRIAALTNPAPRIYNLQCRKGY